MAILLFVRCLTNLSIRGAIEHREKQLKEKFNLAGLSVWESSERKAIPVYEKLYRLGIIQPILHKKLIDLIDKVVRSCTIAEWQSENSF